MRGEPTGQAEESAEAFLLSEYQLLADLRANLVEIYGTGLTRLLTLTTALAAGFLFWLSEEPAQAARRALVLAVIATFLSAVTANFARRGIKYQINTRRYLRGLNAIRAYFVANNPSIATVIKLPTDSDYPPMGELGDLRGIWGGSSSEAFGLAAATTGVASGAWSYLLVSSWIDGDDMALLVASLAGLALFVATILFWQNNGRRAFEAAEEEWRSTTTALQASEGVPQGPSSTHPA